MDSRDGRVRGMSGIAVAPFKAQAPSSTFNGSRKFLVKDKGAPALVRVECQ